MATKNIVPRANNEGGIGTLLKRWGSAFFKDVNISGDMTAAGDVSATGDVSAANVSATGDVSAANADIKSGSNTAVNTLQRSTAYSVDDIVYTSALNAKYYLLCVTAGTTASAMPSFSGATSNTEITDGTVVWRVQTLTSTEQILLAAHPVGSFYESTDSTSPATLFGGTWQEQIPDGELVGAVAAFSGNNALPEGWLLCNGATISRETYATLFDAIGTTYGAGDGSTSFNLPNLVDKFVEGSATAGTEKTAGLPEISGTIGAVGASGSGAFLQTTSISTWQNGSWFGFDRYEFNASRSNPIYGNSTTVQPPAVTMRFAIYSGVVSKKLWIRTI